MMIKFRAWDKISEIYLGGFVKYDDGTYADYDAGCFGDFLDNRRCDVEQFTGLKDMNGKKIYEGDVVKSSYKYAQPKISQVIMECGNGYILGEDLATGNEMLVSDHINEIEVIGNVHTNPELLEAHHE